MALSIRTEARRSDAKRPVCPLGRPLLLVLVAAAVLLVVPAFAQDVTSGSMAGKAVDPTGRGIPDAVVIVTSEYGTRTTKTDERGQFILPNLKPGTYTVRIEAPSGFNTMIQNDVVVGLNQRAFLNFSLTPGKTETITVSARAPLVDATSTSFDTNIKYEEFASSVPLGRAFTDTFVIAPGVVSGLGTGQPNPSIGGASGLENSYLIDGVNVTNTGYGGIGMYNIIYGSLGTGVTSEFLDEVQIKSGGFEAEYGQALGGIVSAIVKSGTNDFKGSVAWYASPPAMRGSSESVDLSVGTSNTTARGVNDFAFSAGGPVKKDRLFYFLAYNPVITTEQRRATRNPNPAFAAASAGPSGVSDYNGAPVFDEATNANAFGVTSLAFPSSTRDLERKRTAGNYAFKLTWDVTPQQQVELTAFGDPITGESGAQRQDAPLYSDFATGGGESRIDYGANNQALKWNAVFGPRFFVEGIVGHHKGTFREGSEVDATNYHDIRNVLEFSRGADHYMDPMTGQPVPFDLTPVAPSRGGIGQNVDQDDESTTYKVKLTNHWGRHEVTYGLEYVDIAFRETSRYTGPTFQYKTGLRGPNGLPLDANGDGVQDSDIVTTRSGALVNVMNDAGNGTNGSVGIAYDTPNVFNVFRARLSPSSPPTQSHEYDGFIEDTWSVGSRVTVKAGLRMTTETVEGSGAFALTLGGTTTTYAPSQYTFAGNLAPRLGVIWDVLGEGKSRLWLNWGRYFERVPNDLASRAFSNEITVVGANFDDRNLTRQATTPGAACEDAGGNPVVCAALAPVFVFGLQPTDVLAGAKLPYEDELSGGFAFEVTPNSSFEVRAIYRSQGRALEDMQPSAVEQVQNFYYGMSGGFPYDPFGGSPAARASTTYPAQPFGSDELGNPGTSKVPPGGRFGFPKAKRDYKAFELVYTRRLHDHWLMLADFRYARLAGFYEGLFRNDNLQSDPNYTSLYDFPDSALTHSQFTVGPLPTDVTQVLRVHPSYQFDNKVRLGASLNWSSGTPRTSMLAHPVYRNSGEIPGIDPIYAYWSDPDVATSGCNSGVGSPCVLAKTKSLAAALSDPTAVTSPFLFDYTPVKRGNLGRIPDHMTLDLHADYPLIAGKITYQFMVDVFNVFNEQQPARFDDNIEMQAGIPDPDFLKPVEYQAPRTVRFSVRASF